MVTWCHLQNCQDHRSRRCGYPSLELRFAIFFQNLVSWSHDCSSKFTDLGFSQWTWGNDRIWSVYFSNGRLNHQLVPQLSKTMIIAFPTHFTPHSTLHLGEITMDFSHAKKIRTHEIQRLHPLEKPLGHFERGKKFVVWDFCFRLVENYPHKKL